jgi:hypothetical protein
MNSRAKRVPRLWCALQGLLPLEACLDAQRAELALPPESGSPDEESEWQVKPRNRVAANAEKREVSRRGSL